MKIHFNLKKINKIKKIMTIISIIALAIPSYAGEWQQDIFGWKYLDDNGKYAVGWRWIDDNTDALAECYRFDQNGYLQANTVTKDGKITNEYGQWVENGIVQKIYAATGKPFESNFSKMFYIEKATTSNTQINASGKDLGKLEAQRDKEESGARIKPNAVFSPSEAGYLLGRKVSLKAPEGGKTFEGNILDVSIKEDEVIVLEEGQEIILGKDMRTLITTSNKLTKEVSNVKIWGGDIWEDAMLLSGNGASVKFDVSKYNYFKMEVAHQTHGTSTADTYCELEYIVNGHTITSFDEFNDDVPEIIEEYLDEGDKTVEFKLTITGDAKGRKVYIRNARVRNIKEKE